VFAAAEYAKIPDEESLLIQGTCSGVWNRGYVRIDGSVASIFGPATPRTELNYFPYREDQQHQVDTVQFGKSRSDPAQRYNIRFLKEDIIEVTQVRIGSFAGTSLFAGDAPPIRWTRESRSSPQITRYRARNGQIEIGQMVTKRGESTPELFWEPVLKAGLKVGQSWPARFPDGQLATYTVSSFGKDEAGRETVEIRRALRNPMQAATWEEAATTYARSVGQIKRIVTLHNEKGETTVVSESRLVRDGSAEPELETPEPNR
jgi:hypothetical protein